MPAEDDLGRHGVAALGDEPGKGGVLSRQLALQRADRERHIRVFPLGNA